MKPNGSRSLPGLRRRHAEGRSYLGQVLAWWLGRSGISYNQLGTLSDWANGEAGLLISSQISHLRRASLRNPNWRLIEAICGVNQAIYDWQTHGPEACAKRLLEAIGQQRERVGLVQFLQRFSGEASLI